MKKLQFNYTTKLEFSQSITGHCYTLRCIPFSDGRQMISEPLCNILPDSGSIWRSRDSFGNILICGRTDEPHTSFSFEVNGEATIVNSSEITGDVAAFYGFHTPLTAPGENIFSFYEQNKPSSKDVISRVEALSEGLHNTITYMGGVTDTSTTAEQAMKLHTGVCQDYAHILLSLLRIERIRCRYVSGLAFESGETHAWVEFYNNGRWIGIDPTHNRLISDHYIKLCHGRDYSDCPIERGIFLGNATSVQTITSMIKEI